MITNSLNGLSLSTIRLFPATTSKKFDPTQPIKDWSALGYVDPNPVVDGFYVFDIVVKDQATQLPKYTKLVMSHEDAELCNPVPPNYIWSGPVPKTVDIPVDKSKIPSGYELGTVFPGNPGLVPSGQNTSPQAGFTQADHQMLVDILSFVRK